MSTLKSGVNTTPPRRINAQAPRGWRVLASNFGEIIFRFFNIFYLTFSNNCPGFAKVHSIGRNRYSVPILILLLDTLNQEVSWKSWLPRPFIPLPR